jgi:hypothetical protein
MKVLRETPRVNEFLCHSLFVARLKSPVIPHSPKASEGPNDARAWARTSRRPALPPLWTIPKTANALPACLRSLLAFSEFGMTCAL